MAGRKFKDIELVIPSGQTNSNDESFTGSEGLSEELHFVAPASLTGTVNVSVSYDRGTTFIPLQSAGADVTIPANKVTILQLTSGWDELRLVSSSAEAAERTFKLRLIQPAYPL